MLAAGYEIVIAVRIVAAMTKQAVSVRSLSDEVTWWAVLANRVGPLWKLLRRIERRVDRTVRGPATDLRGRCPDHLCVVAA